MRISDRKKKRNNSGFSLVEVLVAIVILAIISLPVLSTFANAARINSKARKTENANTAINNIAEEAKTTQLTALEAGKGEYTYVKDETDSNNPFYVVKTKGKEYFQGVNGEKFYIKAKFDKGLYTESASGSGKVSNDINSYGISVYSDLTSNNNYVYRDDFFDDTARKELKGKVGDTYKDEDVEKKTVITISIEEDTSGTHSADDPPAYIQSMNVHVEYTYNKGVTYSCTKDTQMDPYSFSAKFDEDLYKVDNTKKVYNVSAQLKDNAKNFYIFYSPFGGKVTTGEKDPVTGVNKLKTTAKDKIEINYVLPNPSTSAYNVNYSDLGIYLIEQEVYVDSAKENRLRVDGNNNVNVNFMYNTGTIPTADLTKVKDIVKIYSTIKGGELSSDKSTGWNYGNTMKTSDSLFRMTLEVWAWDEDKESDEYIESDRIAAVNTTKEN